MKQQNTKRLVKDKSNLYLEVPVKQAIIEDIAKPIVRPTLLEPAKLIEKPKDENTEPTPIDPETPKPSEPEVDTRNPADN